MAAEAAQMQGLYDGMRSCRWQAPIVILTATLFVVARKAFALIPPLICPLTFLIDAPFGRFTPQNQDSIWLVDGNSISIAYASMLTLGIGIKSWIAMELVAPVTFSYAFLHSPLSPTNFGQAPLLSLSNPPTFLAALFLLHYVNRAIVSPLRTPSRSKSHLGVPLSAVSFNVTNGALMGAYLSSPSAAKFLAGAFSRPLFLVGVGLWALGLAGNILHDEILLNIRRNAKSKGKARAQEDDNNGKNKREHYAIPYGYLYSYISYPNYFCEWMEWLGFALAASPLPLLSSVPAFLSTITPPFLFFYAEVLLMIPRAYKGHRWYHNKFPDYPKERKAAIPFLF